MLSLRRLVFVLLLMLSLGSVVSAQSASTPQPPQSVSEKIAADAGKLDINTATVDQLKALPGIGDVYIKRIIDGRPYTAKNQLVTRGILPQPAYEKIKDQVIAHRPKK
jgi:competence protein ComEA